MSLNKIYDLLRSNAPRKQAYIPNLWLDKKEAGLTLVNYPEFIVQKVDKINAQSSSVSNSLKKDWTKNAIVYNLFVRLFSAFDHDQNGKLGDSSSDITLNDIGLRETGTFLKTIALLPHLKKMGINTIHLLPITVIGKLGRKGDLGSPYAIKNPYKIDPLLADPIIEASVEDQYKSLVEAAELMGMRVVQEFIFRTASMDSDLIQEHPNWFYWIKKTSTYGPPKFSKEDLKQIKQIPKGKGKYFPPAAKYRDQFSIPPEAPDKNLQIASAFADWPPDDLQPPWTDVTYLRLYNYEYSASNNFNYIAYNTIRYYDPELSKTGNINTELWDNIQQIIPYYQKNFGIQGAMIDMGHALPEDLKKNIIENARKIDPAFAFWDENFENSIETKKEGYNAVIGGAWYDITKRNGFKNQILSLKKKRPLPYFGAAETHNSPRFGVSDSNKKFASWVLFNLLPNAIPFLHNGFELEEQLPVNSGLNFSKSDLEQLVDKPLALFYKTSLDWSTPRTIIPQIEKLNELRIKYPWIFDGINIELSKTDNPKVLGFQKIDGNKKMIVLFNTNFHRRETFRISSISGKNFEDLIVGINYDFSKKIALGKGKLIMTLSA